MLGNQSHESQQVGKEDTLNRDWNLETFEMNLFHNKDVNSEISDSRMSQLFELWVKDGKVL